MFNSANLVQNLLAPNPPKSERERVGYRFFASPSHRLTDLPRRPVPDELLEPELPYLHEAVERAFSGAEFRDGRARDRLNQLLFSDAALTLRVPGDESARSAIFAQPPSDLPALLRLADQLDWLAIEEVGERALVWRCECGTRYAVPVALVREVSIRCENCTRSVELNRNNSLGEESLTAPRQQEVNEARKRLAGFFRESMARGWPVLVWATGAP